MFAPISKVGAFGYRQWSQFSSWLVRRRRGLPPLSTPPVTSIPDVDRSAFHRSGYVTRPVGVLPYAHQGMNYVDEGAMLDLDDPLVPVDHSGVALWRNKAGVEHDHPVFSAQYALAALSGYTRTGDERYLQRALTNAEHLLDISQSDESGALWFPYRFPHQYYDVIMPVPWWSGMAQGQVLSLFTRISEMLPHEPQWRKNADAIFRSFDGWRALGKPWITTMDAHGCLWFEEYAGDVEPLLVMNGQIFALYGLYDYIHLTGDPHARDLFDGGATTVIRHIDTIRVRGDYSYYCTREGYCQRPEWQNRSYHPIHIQQFRMLAEMTGDERFEQAARDFESDIAR